MLPPIKLSVFIRVRNTNAFIPHDEMMMHHILRLPPSMEHIAPLLNASVADTGVEVLEFIHITNLRKTLDGTCETYSSRPMQPIICSK
jgi:hypothetical protein